MSGSLRAVLFDVDGTLVDTNYLHAVTWWQAFAQGGHYVPMADIHRAIGMGSDQMLDRLLPAGRDKDADTSLRAWHDALYATFWTRLRPLPGAAALLRACKARGLAVVLASSAGEAESGVLRAALDADDAIDDATFSGEVESTKPAPDLVQVALEKAAVPAGQAVFVGDTVWDVRASRKAGVPCIGMGLRHSRRALDSSRISGLGSHSVSAGAAGVEEGSLSGLRSAVLTYALAVLAACANGVSSVLQRKANKRVPQRENLSPRLVWSLLHEPVWFGGIVALTVGFVLQASALGTGQLSLVEPVLVLELPVTLVLSSRVFRQRLGLWEWLPAAGMTAGLGGLLFLLAPSAGKRANVHWYMWLAGVGVNLALVGCLTAWARSRPAGQAREESSRHQGGAFRAAVLAVAAGSAFGLTAALMKAMTTTFAGGLGGLFSSWQVYAMVAAGALGMFLTQSAMNAGQLIAAQPGLTLSDPLVSVLWGVLVFGEQVRQGWYILGEVACAGVIVAAVIALACSPLLSGDGSPGRDDGDHDGRAPESASDHSHDHLTA